MNVLEKYFSIKLSKGRIKRHLNRIEPLELPEKTDGIIVSAVQRAILPVKRVEDYIDMLNGFIREASLKRSDLVVFPEYNFLDLLGIVPGFNVIANNRGKEEIREAALFHSLAEPIGQAVEKIMCELAQKYKINIYTGGYFTKEDNKLFNCGSLISRDGKILGTQKKLHLTDFEKSIGLTGGTCLEVYETDFGRLACPVSTDGNYFEAFSILLEKSCDIAVLPTAGTEGYSFYKSFSGACMRAQEYHMFIVKPSLNGSLSEMKFNGRAGIYAPLSITNNGRGAAAFSREAVGNRVITAALDLENLHKARENAEYFGDRNAEFENYCFNKT